MSTTIAQTPQFPVRTPKKESVLMSARAINSTADGVIDTVASTYSDPGINVVRSSAGTYAVTFPACPSDVVVDFYFGVHTGTANVFWLRCTAFAPTSGTATLITSVAAGGAAADNNSAGMQISMWLLGVTRGGN
jgi:hypothetical protein